MNLYKIYIVTRTVDNGKYPLSVACLTQESVFNYIEKEKKKDMENRQVEYKTQEVYFCNADLEILQNIKVK